MESTPKKTTSLRRVPIENLISSGSEVTPKKVRFGVGKESVSGVSKGTNKLYKAEDVITMIDDSSLSEDETSSDEEWIITKSKALQISDFPELKKNTNLANERTLPLKTAVVKVTPLKLLRKTEYEVNKISALNKKSEPSVSPIIIKRKTDTIFISDATVSPLTPSSKINTSKNNVETSSVRRSQRRRKPVARYDSDTENECSPPKRKPQNRKSRYTKNSNPVQRNNRNSSGTNSSKNSDSDDNEPIAERLKTSEKNNYRFEEKTDEEQCNNSEDESLAEKLKLSVKLISSPDEHLNSLNNTDSDDDKPLADRLNLITKKSFVPPDSKTVSPDLKRIQHTPRSSARKRLELTSPSVAKVVSDSVLEPSNLRRLVLTPRTSVRKQLKLSSPKYTEISPDALPVFTESKKKPLRTSARKKLELLLDSEVPPDNFPSTPDQKCKSQTPRRSTRKKKLSSPLNSEVPLNENPVSSDLKKRALTPRKCARKKIELPSSSESCSEGEDLSDLSEEFKTPKKTKKGHVNSPSLRKQVLTPRHSTKKSVGSSSPGVTKKFGPGFLTPIGKDRARCNQLLTPTSKLDMARASLHTSNIPKSLPCREKEFNNILTFTMRKIEDKAGGCMYISGVPGTGKTATVHGVIKLLQEKVKNDELSKFDFVEVNALRLTEPRRAYTRIWLELSGEKCSPEMAMTELEKKFSKKSKHSTVILIDELDYLCNRRQDVIYNILEWSTKSSACLTVITIANTMDLPERTLKGKVTSRMGLTRLVFQPYTFQQLQQIVLDRIGTKSNFHADAIQLVARKVAAVSGDARRALDICRRATELISSDSEIVTVAHIEKALNQIFSGTRIQGIKKCGVMNQFLLRAMRDEFHRTGVEESTISQVFPQFSAIVSIEGYDVPPIGFLLTMASTLSDSGLIIAEKSRTDLNRKLSLNVSPDDIHYALSC